MKAKEPSRCTCGNTKQPMQVACKTCWALVPRPLQATVYRLFRTARRGGEHIASVRRALTAIKAARAGLPVCRQCGCTDTDCRHCVERTGKPCHWIEKDLCSACDPELNL